MLHRCSTGCARKSGLRERTSDVVCKGSLPMSALLDGKVVVVTGGGHGIGRAYCLGIAHEGGKVVVAALDGPAAEQVACEVTRAGGEALGVEMDVVQFGSCQEMTRRT